MFSSLQLLPKDPIFVLYGEYISDLRPNKINLGIGIYADPEGKPFVFPAVQKVATSIGTNNFNYDPMQGNISFLESAKNFLLPSIPSETLAIQQTCGGTQGISLCGAFALRAGMKSLVIGTPTWGNHLEILSDFEILSYNHLDENQKPNKAGLESALKNAPKKSLVLLHGGATHNPTGFNFTAEDIISLKDIILEKEHLVFLDFAYLGFHETADADKVWAEKVMQAFPEIACAYSFSKNASLYKHRTGIFFLKTDKKDVVESHLQNIIRTDISMPPSFGAQIMDSVLRDFSNEWKAELLTVRQDIDSRRNSLLEALPNEFSYLKNSRGLFALLPLQKAQVEKLKNEYAIFIPSSGRINFGGIKTQDIAYIADCLQKVL